MTDVITIVIAHSYLEKQNNTYFVLYNNMHGDKTYF